MRSDRKVTVKGLGYVSSTAGGKEETLTLPTIRNFTERFPVP